MKQKLNWILCYIITDTHHIIVAFELFRQNRERGQLFARWQQHQRSHSRSPPHVTEQTPIGIAALPLLVVAGISLGGCLLEFCRVCCGHCQQSSQTTCSSWSNFHGGIYAPRNTYAMFYMLSCVLVLTLVTGSCGDGKCLWSRQISSHLLFPPFTVGLARFAVWKGPAQPVIP